MKKLIIITLCAFAAQATQAGDFRCSGDDIWSQIRQSNQTDQITQAIADQGKVIARAIEKQNAQPDNAPSITTEQMLALEAKDRAEAVLATKPHHPFILPATGTESKEELEKLIADANAQRAEYKKALAEWEAKAK